MGILDTQPVDFNYFLARKYALQGQEADATTQNAASQAIQARTGAAVGASTVALNNTTNKLMPAESAAKIAEQNARTRLVGTQADLLPFETQANIGLTRAQTTLAGVSALSTVKNEIDATDSAGRLTPGPALSGILGANGYQGYQLPALTPTRRRADPVEQAGVRVFRGF